MFVCACVCTRACLSKTDGNVWLCLCAENESISFTLVSLPDRRGRWVPHVLVASLFPSSFIPSVFSNMFVSFCLYCSPSHLSHALPVSFIASYPFITTLCLHLPITGYIHLFILNFFGCFLLFCLLLSHQHSLRVHYNRTFSPYTYPSSILSFSLSIRQLTQNHRRKVRGCNSNTNR